MVAKATFKWNKSRDQIARELLGGDKAELFAASEWRRLIDPWVPMKSGNLAHDETVIYVEGHTGIIHYQAPYAAKQYRNKHYNRSTAKHPLASAEWDRMAIQAGKAKVLGASIEAFLRRGGAR